MNSFISKLRALCTNAFDSIGNRETHADGGGTPVSYTANDLNQHTAAALVNYHFDDDGNLLEAEAGEGPAAFRTPGHPLESERLLMEEIS